MIKIVNLANFGEITGCGQTVLPDRSGNITKVDGKCQNGDFDEFWILAYGQTVLPDNI